MATTRSSPRSSWNSSSSLNEKVCMLGRSMTSVLSSLPPVSAYGVILRSRIPYGSDVGAVTVPSKFEFRVLVFFCVEQFSCFQVKRVQNHYSCTLPAETG